jgi:hypothetical protein
MPVRAADNMIKISEWPNSLVLSIHQPEQAVFTGKVSLPNGTPLLLTLRRIGVWSLADRAQYMAQSETTVSDGEFKTEAFRDKDADLKPGEYLIEIDALVPAEFSGPASEVGDPIEALKHNTEYTVLMGRIYHQGPINRHIHYRTIYYLHGAPNPAAVVETCQRQASERIEIRDMSGEHPVELPRTKAIDCIKTESARGWFAFPR